LALTGNSQLETSKHEKTNTNCITVGGVSAAVSKTAAAPIERIKLLIQNQVGHHLPSIDWKDQRKKTSLKSQS
jgi:hypothetical protein